MLALSTDGGPCSDVLSIEEVNDHSMHEEVIVTCADNPIEEISQLNLKSTKKDSKKKGAANKQNVLFRQFIHLISTIDELESVFGVSGRGNNKNVFIKRRNLGGYRFHPATIRELALFQQFASLGQIPPPGLAVTLIAKLIQDNIEEDIIESIWSILCNEFCTPLVITRNDVESLINQIAIRSFYGPVGFEGKLPQQEGLYIWEIREPKILQDSTIITSVLADRQSRQRALSILEEKFTLPTTDLTAEVKAEASCTLIPSQKEEINPFQINESIDSDKTQPTTVPPQQAPSSIKKVTKPNAKLSSFFSITKKTSNINDSSQVGLFQPFCPKLNQFLAPTNHFDCCGPVRHSSNIRIESGIWSRGVWLPVACRRKRTRCVGNDLRPQLLVVKLIQFHENYRPAYFGTLKSKININGRQPFSKYMELDYEYDSDDDWGDDEDILDAESITGSDEEEEEEEEEPASSIIGSDDRAEGWLVPDGYISEDEGLEGEETTADDLHERKRRLHSSTIDPRNVHKEIKRDPKRRYIEKEPIIVGPFILNHNNKIPLSFELYSFEWIDCLEGPFLDPFALPIPSDSAAGIKLSSLSAPSNTEKTPKTPFNDELMLPDLARIINGSNANLQKLFEAFSARHGNIAKRQFELKINQIATRQKGEGKNSMWIIRAEYQHLLSNSTLT